MPAAVCGQPGAAFPGIDRGGCHGNRAEQGGVRVGGEWHDGFAELRAARAGSPGLLAAVAAFAALGFSTDIYMLYIAIMVGAVSGLAPPAINGVLSRQVPDNSQGELQGAVNAASSLATIIGPLAATQIFSYFTTTPGSPGYFPGAPFIAASASVAKWLRDINLETGRLSEGQGA